MKHIKKILPLLLILILILPSVVSCGMNNTSADVHVFYYTYSDTYISTVRSSLDKALSNAGVKYQDHDGNNNQTTQTEQVQTAITKGAKLLVVNIVTTGSDDAASGIVSLAKSASIPVIFFNREVSDTVVKSYDKCAFIGTDASEAGKLQGDMIGDYVVKNYDKIDLNGDGEISYVLFMGEKGNNEAIYRTRYSVENADKKLTGVVANVACPAQVLEHQNFVSSDYMGKLKGLIREKYGKDVNLLGLISPAGDMCPRDLIRWVDSPVCKKDPNIHRDKVVERRADPSMFEIKGCEKIAKRIANEIFWALEDVCEYVTDSDIEHKNITIDMPLRRVTIAEFLEAENYIKSFFANCKSDTINYEDNANMLIHSGTTSRYETQQTLDLYPIEVHVLRIGDVAFATNPYELFLNYGNQMRARSLAKQTFLIQLACGSFGYLPTKKAQDGSHYSAFVGSGCSGYEGGDLLVRKTVQQINKLFDK